ncbi:MAG: hypothetical protein C0511_20270 [Hyphomicrobium sp.]|nr:hypothetical protein [Hyphomicrobium sp.]
MGRRNGVAHIFQAAWLALAVLMLPACTAADDAAPDYRYRLTVEVETPQGLRTGSSVIEVRQIIGRSGSSPLRSQIYRHAKGEAVAVDLPGGKTLFALLRSDNDVEWAAQVMHRIAPEIQGETSEEAFDNVLLIKGAVELPRTFPPVAWIPERSAYPMLVTFGDLADPTSVAEVNPDDLAASFGEGVHLKRITVELTDDPVTSGIEERMGWLANHVGTLVYRPRDVPIGEMPLAHRVNGTDFVGSGQ